MGDRCEVQKEAQVNREVDKITPHSDSATAQMMLDGLTWPERERAAREMREALEREAQKKPAPETVDAKDFGKYGIKVDGDVIKFPNGIEYKAAQHKLVNFNNGTADGPFLIKKLKDENGHTFRQEIHGVHNKDGSENVLGYYDQDKHLLHVKANGGELIIDDKGKVTFQADKVACEKLPNMTLEKAKELNRAEAKKREKEDLKRPWDQ